MLQLRKPSTRRLKCRLSSAACSGWWPQAITGLAKYRSSYERHYATTFVSPTSWRSKGNYVGQCEDLPSAPLISLGARPLS